MKLTTIPVLFITAGLVVSCKTAETSSGAHESATTSGYGECQSQTAEAAEQRAPSFLTQMQTCQSQDTSGALTLARQVGAGQVNEQGDCAFKQAGVTCHYHTGQEFLGAPSDHEVQGIGEMHCIVPTNDPTHPSVFGAHIRCKAHTEATLITSHGGEAVACKSELLDVFSHCSAMRCCDNGTLTGPIATQTATQRALHPNFRICTDEAVEIDCGLLAPMHGHAANVPALGGIVEPVFEPHHT